MLSKDRSSNFVCKVSKKKLIKMLSNAYGEAVMKKHRSTNAISGFRRFEGKWDEERTDVQSGRLCHRSPQSRAC